MKNIYGIYGASGFGKEVLPLVKKYVVDNGDSSEDIFFIDDAFDSIGIINGYTVISFNDFLTRNADERYVTVAISNSMTREKITDKCSINNIKFLEARAENVIQLDEVFIGEGAILSPFVTLTSNIKIGKSFHANIYSYVAHDCIIGDYVTFAPAVKCNGNIKIEDHVYIGTGVIIKQGRPNRPLVIGKGAVIGAGAVVTKNVPAGITVFGNPAIELTKENLKRRN